MRLALLLLWGKIPAAVKNLLLQTAFMDSLHLNSKRNIGRHMRTLHRLIFIVFTGVPIGILAHAQQPIADVQPNAPFIEPGNDYHIFFPFPDERNPFVYAFTEMSESFEKKPDGSKTNIQQVPVKVTIRSDIFHVLQLHGESWALVQHPASKEDYSAWYGKHRARYLLQQPANLSAEQLANVREGAARDIKVTETWINLNHALTIKPVSAHSLEINEQ